MVKRLVFYVFVVLLILPSAAFTPPTAVGLLPPHEIDVEAKNRGKNNKPKFRTVTRTVRQPLTQTFTNLALIDIPDTEAGVPALYPSPIEVSGFANGRILDVNLTLHRITFDDPEELHVLLQPAHLSGKNAIVMADVGNDRDVEDVSVILDDQADSLMPTETADVLEDGTFQPTNGGNNADPFPAPAPATSTNSLLSVFNGTDPNGTWQLFAFEDGPTFGNDGAQTIEGWSLQITAEVDVQVKERVKIRKDKKGKRSDRR